MQTKLKEPNYFLKFSSKISAIKNNIPLTIFTNKEYLLLLLLPNWLILSAIK